MMTRLFSLALLTLLGLAFSSVQAFAAPDFSKILDWQIGFSPSATPAMDHITDFHTMLMYIITAIVVFVTGLLVFVMVRFNAKANPKPSATTHNVMLEVLWTVVPVVILIVIAVPSFKLLFFEARNPEPELTVKVIGHQWNWEYVYPDNGEISYISNMLKDDELDLAKGHKRLLSTDAPLVLPVDTNVVFEVTATDVIHSFAVPRFGIKVDAVPGRLNSTWARVRETGTYFGQCSEICGKGHGFMPIEISVVSKEEFANWVKAQGGTMPEKSAAVQAPVMVDSAPMPDSVVEPSSDLPLPQAVHE